MSINIPSIRHLSTILSYYAPNLKTLTIEKSWISKEEMVKLGRCLSCLEIILVKNCTGENRCEETFDPAFLGRTNNIQLRIDQN